MKDKPMHKYPGSKLMVLTAALTAVAFLAGCASDGQNAKTDAELHTYSEGMICPECETVWVTKRKQHGSPRIINRLSHERKMACPDCDEMARSQLLDDGKVMLHDCPMCKVTPKQIQAEDRPKRLSPRP